MNKQLLLKAVFGEEIDYIPPDDKVEEALTTLKAAERFVIERRFGEQRMTLQAIGQQFPRQDGRIGVLKERIRQIEAKALRKLRHPSRCRLLYPDWSGSYLRKV